MGMRVNLAHKIGEKSIPYDLPCEVILNDGVTAQVQIVTACGLVKTRTVQADQVVFRMESA